MRKSLRVIVHGKNCGPSYYSFIQKHAQNLGVEGTIQAADNGSVVICACGASDKLDSLIDYLYKGTSSTQIDDIVVEPYINEKDYRGVFRVIGE